MTQLLVANYFIMFAKGSCDKNGHSLGSAGFVVLQSAVPQISLTLKNNTLQISATILDKTTWENVFINNILTWTKRKPTNKKQFTQAVLSTKFHGTPSSHRKVRPHIRFLLHPLKTVRFCSSRRTRAHCYMFSCCSNLAGLESVESDL